jgi:hypothetical protein
LGLCLSSGGKRRGQAPGATFRFKSAERSFEPKTLYNIAVANQTRKLRAHSRIKLFPRALGRLKFRPRKREADPSKPFFTQVNYFLNQDKSITYGDLVNIAKEQAYGLLILLLSIPSLLPGVNLGMAPIGGLITMWIGVQMALGRRSPKLPKQIKQHRVHKSRVGAALMKIEGYLERFGRRDKTRSSLNNRWVGLMVAWVSFLLFIPVPLPFANFIPAAILVLFGATLLERRPSWGWAAAFATVVNTIYFGFFYGLILNACIKAFRMVWRWLT